MEKHYPIGGTIRTLRRQRGISQEVLAQALDVSIQAVSKWETNASLPDILLMPAIARFFGVTIDYLYHGDGEQKDGNEEIPDDGKWRIVQYCGRHLIRQDEYDRGKAILLDTSRLPADCKWEAEIWGSADIQGDVGGGVQAGAEVNCANVGGNILSGNGVNCGNVGGGIQCGDGVNCGNVRTRLTAGISAETSRRKGTSAVPISARRGGSSAAH